MSSESTPARRYTDEEVSKLLKRATDIQEEDSARTRRDVGTGMTLAELQEIAAEAGIDPKYLQRAAANLDQPKASGLGPALAGTPLTVRVERVIPGELDPDGFERIVPEIQRVSIGHGNPAMVGRTLTWRSDTVQNQRSLQVTVSSRDGETWVQAEERLHGLAGALYGGVLGGVGGGVGIGAGVAIGIEVFGSALLAFAFPTILIGTLYLGLREAFKRIGNTRRRELEGLVDQIAQYVQPAAEPLAGRHEPGALPSPE